MCGFYCITFIEYITAGKALLDYTNLLLPNDYQKKDKLIYKYFKEKRGRRKYKPKHKTRNYLLEEVTQNDLMSKKHKKYTRFKNMCHFVLALKLFEQFLNFVSAVSGCLNFCFCLASW